MLNEKTIEIIKSTVPVLKEHGTTITTRFYELLFSKNPDLLNIFNHVNQKQGRQQTALANAVYAAAVHIDQLEAILPAVKQIAHKHRSLGVKAEHYPSVGENLLQAIKDVLGDAATDEIISAWADAYGVIANVFISVENEMYEHAETQSGGWEGFRNFIVDRKVQESDVITSFYLKPEDKKTISSYEAGQYISVKLKAPGEQYEMIRQYSLSDSPNEQYYRISVKREDAIGDKAEGMASTYLHNQVNVGDVLQISAPAGDFVLNTAKTNPVVLISGGVGLTPMVSMLHTLAEQQPEREVVFIHAAVNSKVHALREEVAVLAEKPTIQSFVCYESPTEQDRLDQNFDKDGYIDKEWLKSIISTIEADVYFCGPIPFMKAINESLLDIGFKEENIHFEFFGPKSDLSSSKNDLVTNR
ncbi:NO-inducible flavohemoprotein [Bacillus suaedaesalsae]|uniref:Flavohemoprotein n=1 Tax=Bacillus suaedaesalsae TaxID=2810349 RepID=A0ABS2DLV4_9BACI|nr:NO-inducible flavohemoprotein [Bacillus suaedaesalsae]MBM6618506.1 NO-inducible flavohemoprotein [Bacillus suaedaesalsae]